MNESVERRYEKPETKKHDALNTVQGSHGYYNLYYKGTSLYYNLYYKYNYVSLYYKLYYYYTYISLYYRR